MGPDDGAGGPRGARPIHLALQGGGAHGALSWGVLDRLLEDGRLDIRAISGTSAGAMNAVVLADGFAQGGPEGARAALGDFWRAVSDAARLSPMRRGLWDRLLGRYSLDGSAGYLFLDGLARLVSPYALNPLGLNPLREILAARVDFDRVNAGAIAVHVAATNVRTGLPRVFSRGELTADAVMASACLPQMYPAVEIDGEAYWDGGFTSNPALLPLIEDPSSRDILIVQLNPTRRDEVPRSARAIINRMNEIEFNASLMKELGAIAWVERRIAEGERAPDAVGRLRLHRIHGEEGMEDVAASSKLDAGWDYLRLLFERGRARAGVWLAEDFPSVGRASTLDHAALAPAQTAAAPGSTRRARRWLRLPFAWRVAR